MIGQNRNKNKGIALATAILLMTILGLLLPLLFNLTERETKWAVDSKHSSVATELASAGIDRALWKLKETNDNWIYLSSTGPLTGYNYDIDYSDVNEDDGVYRVKIATTSDPDTMLLEATAKNTKSNVFKAVRAYAKRTQISAALHGYNLINSTTTAGNFLIHWGPIYDTGSLTLNTENINQLYPRKYAVGSISVMPGADTYYGSRDTSPSTPNSNNEYFAYTTVPPIVTPDFDYYRNAADAAGTYWSGNLTLNSTVTAPGQIFFIEGDAIFKKANKFIQGIVVVMGDCTLKGNNTSATSPYANNYSTVPHSAAYMEYLVNTPAGKNQTGLNLVPDSSAQDEYPGDGGLATTKSFTMGSTAGGAYGRNVSLKGFLYCGGDLNGGNTNPQVIHGALALSKTSEIESGFFEIFYNPDLKIRTAASEIYISQWEEIEPIPF